MCVCIYNVVKKSYQDHTQTDFLESFVRDLTLEHFFKGLGLAKKNPD